MTARAGIVVTGTEVLTGRVADANGPWLAEDLRSRGVDVGRIVVVGDRPDDLVAALRSLADHDLVLTSGGLGPTADDLTAQVVADLRGRPTRLDVDLEERVSAIATGIARQRGWDGDSDAFTAGIRKQAMVPEGAGVLEPVGTAPGLVVPANEDGPVVVVLPGPPRELQPMWTDAVDHPLVREALSGAEELRQSTVRLWGPPEAELAALLRDHEETHPGALDDLEVTTCLRDGELEVVVRHSPAAQERTDALVAALTDRFGDAVFSPAGERVDDLVAEALIAAGATVATAESCTAGLVAGRLADRPGSSAYLRGGVVAYANDVKTDHVGVPAETIERVGAVSEEVAVALAEGVRERYDATYGIGVTGVAGPGGGTPEKPVGLVHVAVAGPDGVHPRRLQLGGDRDHVRRRTVVSVLHLLREVLAR
ncbi:competence/damage-inducible protein A [Nocardioides sp. CFH 31398]|uniref:competence/damage-inducible protein A n=1 Tax=Nocardioides sp. CFH 31398 TaxID=2919579 RepID=UPI001F057B88|nr:competence/damage-inducible protein A [Nocardioides sp. CFH 31398]MCH1866959.1 competence/damage-inducible protein A [Nocardioides sp. CFH 31398]